MTCPRRIGTVAESEHYTGLKVDQWNNDDCCTFCGSVNPDKVIELIKQGCTVTRTDKNYKIYINGDNVPRGAGMAKVYLQHFSKEQINQMNQALGYI